MMLVCLLLAAGDLVAIESAYSDAEFETVTQLVPRQEGKPLTAQQKKRVYELGAFAEYFLGHESKAAAYFQAMFRVDPNASIDERKYPPKAVAFYKTQRPKQQVVITNPPPPPAKKAEGGLAPVGLVPFGIGHFILGDIPAGVVFMVVPAALIATSVALYWVRRGERQPGDLYANKARADAMQISQNVAAFAAIGVTIYGMIDGLVFAKDRVAARKNRAASIVPSGVPNGAGLALSLQY